MINQNQIHCLANFSFRFFTLNISYNGNSIQRYIEIHPQKLQKSDNYSSNEKPGKDLVSTLFRSTYSYTLNLFGFRIFKFIWLQHQHVFYHFDWQ